MKKVMIIAGFLLAPWVAAAGRSVSFHEADANKDGAVTRKEAASFAFVARGFDDADANHNGLLELHEFLYIQSSEPAQRE